MGNTCGLPHLGLAHLGPVVPFVAITSLLLMAIACTPSSAPSDGASLRATTLAPTPMPTLSAPAPTLTSLPKPTLSPTIALDARTPTPASTPDLEREAILSFNLQALEIEAKRNELIAYFASLSYSVGIHGQALAIERFFPTGVPPTLRGAPPSGIEGMATLRNTLLLLDCPQSIQPIKDALLHVYDSEVQQALNQSALWEISGFALPGKYTVDLGGLGDQSVQIQSAMLVNWGAPIRNLVYPEITRDSLDYWRQLAEQSEVGPVKNLFKYKVETVWFNIQGFRQQTYSRWAELLQERGIDPIEAGVAVRNAPEGVYPQTPGSIGEEAYGPFFSYMNVLGIGEGYLHFASLAQRLHDIFRMQQRVGIFAESGVENEPDWEVYVQLHGGTVSEVGDEGRRLLGSVLRMTPEQREQAGLTFEPGAPGNIGELQDLIRFGSAYRGGLHADYLASRVPSMLQQWQMQKPQTAAGTLMPFLDYFASTFSLTP